MNISNLISIMKPMAKIGQNIGEVQNAGTYKTPLEKDQNAQKNNIQDKFWDKMEENFNEKKETEEAKSLNGLKGNDLSNMSQDDIVSMIISLVTEGSGFGEIFSMLSGIGDNSKSSASSAKSESTNTQNNMNSLSNMLESLSSKQSECKGLNSQLKGSISFIERQKNLLSTEIININKEVESQQKELEKIEERVNELAKEADKLQSSDKPEDQERLKAIAREIVELVSTQEKSAEKLEASVNSMNQKSSKFETLLNTEIKKFEQMQKVAESAETFNNQVENFSKTLKSMSESTKSTGEVTEATGTAAEVTGTTTTAAAGAAAVPTLGISTTIIPESTALTAEGATTQATGIEVSQIGEAGIEISNSALSQSANAKIDIQGLMSEASKAIQSSGDILNNMNKTMNTSNISQKINNNIKLKIESLKEIQSRVENMAGIETSKEHSAKSKDLNTENATDKRYTFTQKPYFEEDI